ncbi:hypothetical protein AB0A76_18645 [Streptomyces exfoliatus]|uniref:Uncharacterized protein n=1 Tax=Streptomyces exfoliatus TaxID=1905 RepID=A0ABV3CYA9_STREX
MKDEGVRNDLLRLPRHRHRHRAENVTVTDALPAGLTFVSSPDGCTATGQQVTCPHARP